MTVRSDRFSAGHRAWRDRTEPAISARDSNADRSPSAVAATGIGVALREAREARNVSHATAERETHIPRHHLQALEEERFSVFSAPVYVRGFLRSYSQYLGLDSTELLAMLPPDGPAEDERLQPLSRLGHPRGPREAARARRSPTERDAAPLTESQLRRAATWNADDAEDSPESGRMRFAIDGRSGLAGRPPVRLDPLGRLGWPQSLDEAQAQAQDPEPEDEWELPLPEPEFRPRSYAQTRETPLTSRAGEKWSTTASWQNSIPADVRPLFASRPMLVAACSGFAILALVALSLALGGGDRSPDVYAAAAHPQAASIADQARRAAPLAHGVMPDVRGTNQNTALAALKNTGVVPIVIQDASVDPASSQVATQIPPAGTSLDPQTPVMLVLGAIK